MSPDEIEDFIADKRRRIQQQARDNALDRARAGRASGKGLPNQAGLYSRTSRLFSQKYKFEANHSPPTDSYGGRYESVTRGWTNVGSGAQCVHTMEYDDHRALASTQSQSYRDDLAADMKMGNYGMVQALNKDIQDIVSRTGSKYKEGLRKLVKCHRDTMESITRGQARKLLLMIG
jgi:hypothetical protein